ncbi:MAG: ABC transporter ATP-binding protein [Acidobacteriota bacterium]
MNTAITAHGLGKQYRIGSRDRFGSLRDALTRQVSAALGRLRRSTREEDTSHTIWALREVSFEIQPGEIVGLIGRNGSGKSTLLKILSRITDPTAGSAEVRGRVGSLLEVGTGFHHELTGRENVFVNGAILGMTRAEITRKFDEIVAFADVDTFIDTPVKRYSSGMQMRLAFAVAAHLEPEILLVDEVLAVGDIAFQKKCLGKMDDVRRQGRTILFVSHQLNQLRRLCGRCLWLDAGGLAATGPVAEVINRYEASFFGDAALSATDAGVSGAQFLSWTLDSMPGEPAHTLDHLGAVTVRFLLRLDRPIRNGHHGITLCDREGLVVWGAGTDNLSLQAGVHEIRYTFQSLPLRPGPYRWHVSLFEEGRFVTNLDCVPELSVETRPLGHRRDELAGVINLPFTLEVQAPRGQALPATASHSFRDESAAKGLARAR